MPKELDITYKDAEIEVNHLRALYIKVKGAGMMTLEEYLRVNITEEFWAGLLSALEHREIVNISIRGKTGSCSLYGNTILMADGTIKKVEELKIGDEIISPINEKQTIYARVKNLEHCTGDIYDVCDSQGKILYSCTANHKIPIYKYVCPRGKKGNYNERPKELRYWKREDIKAEELYNRKTKKLNKQNKGSGTAYNNGIVIFSTPEICEFKNVEKEEINPYLLGVWLGDGHFTDTCGITTSSKELVNEFRKYISNVGLKKKTQSKTYRFCFGSDFVQSLIRLGLRNKRSGDKFIPEICKRQNKEYRIQLLSGLIDTDGCINEKRGIYYTSKSEKLVDDISFLVHTLGGKAKKREFIGTCKNGKNGEVKGKYYGLSIALPRGILELRKEEKKKEV